MPRRHFGLHQRELAAYLGVSPELVKHIEAVRRDLTATVQLRRRPLLRLLPPAPVSGSVYVPEVFQDEPPAAPPDPAPLEDRLIKCLQEAIRVRFELDKLVILVRHAQR